MPTSPPVTKDVLFEYFAGRATALQKEVIGQWLLKPANEEFFYECLHEWETRGIQYSADLDQGLARFRAHVASQKAQPEPDAEPGVFAIETYQPVTRRRWLWQAAASVLLVLGAGAYLLREPILNKTYQTAEGQVLNLTLPDQSQVVLNGNSVLQVPRFGFGAYSRRVFLQGEANFSVVHTADDKRFIVASDRQFNVTVLGTVFTVLARPEKNKVVLSEGKVRVDFGALGKGQKPFIMEPGHIVEVDKASQQVSVARTAHPKNHAAWRYHRFEFENTTLAEIQNLIKDDYGLTVELRDKELSRLTVSGSFHAADANEILQGLSEALDVNVIRQNDHVLITAHNQP